MVMCLEVLEHLDKPEEALGILGKFNERWQSKYREYLTENAI